MDLTADVKDDILIINTREDRIDAARAIQFKDRMRELTHGVKSRVILNLDTVTFVDSSGLGAIVASLKQVSPETTLELAALTPPVDKVFRLTRMDSIFRIHDTLDSAMGPDPQEA